MNSPCRKRKRSENTNKPNIYGLTNYSPNIPIGDTVDTLSIFRDWICTHYTQTNQNVDKIQALMIKTFYLRRKIILDYGVVKYVLQHYPYLKNNIYVSFNIIISVISIITITFNKNIQSQIIKINKIIVIKYLNI